MPPSKLDFPSLHHIPIGMTQTQFAATVILLGLTAVSANPWMYNDRSANMTNMALIKSLGTPSPPCCSDSISSIACKRLLMTNPTKFLNRCMYDADFSLIQCCGTCGLESAADRYEALFKDGEYSKNCFDRHSNDFCMRFLKKEDVWGKSVWSCDGQFASLAFRICRKTCNYCNREIYRTSKGRYAPSSCGKTHELISSE